MSEKLSAGAVVPAITLPTVAGDPAPIGGTASRWRVVFVYRGLHCGVCKSYLARLEGRSAEFEAEGIDLIAVSGDTREQAVTFAEAAGLTIPVAYGLSVEQMQALGLYISAPFVNTDAIRPFPEPGLFLVSPEGRAHMIEIPSSPFMRPDLDLVLRGAKMAKNDGYPVRGTMEA